MPRVGLLVPLKEGESTCILFQVVKLFDHFIFIKLY